MRTLLSLSAAFGLLGFVAGAAAQDDPPRPPAKRPDDVKRDGERPPPDGKRPPEGRGEDFKRPPPDGKRPDGKRPPDGRGDDFKRPPFGEEGRPGERIEELRKMIERLERELGEIQRGRGGPGGVVERADVLKKAAGAMGRDVRMIVGRPGGPVRKEKATYLGLASGSIPAALRSHLKLPAGTGMTVEFVEPDGPAKAAGIQQHDILLKLNDQILINAHQLAVLVRTFKPGDQVALALIREGKQQTVSVKLVEKEVPVLEEHGPFGGGFGEMPFGRWLGDEIGGLPMLRDGRIERIVAADGKQQLVWSDGEHTLQVSGAGEARKLVAKDREGKIVFEGLIGTPDQRKAVPDEIARKLRAVERHFEARPGVEFEFDFRGGQPGRPGQPGGRVPAPPPPRERE